MRNHPIGDIPSVNEEVPGVVILRLPQYVRALTDLKNRGIDVVRSKQLGNQLQMTPAQIRKDLSYFGRFGKQGRGYPVLHLLGELRQVLGLDNQWNTCLIGVGRLGTAIIEYPGFTPEGFNIVAAFDTDRDQINNKIGQLVVKDIGELGETIKKMQIMIAIVAVPARHAQEVVDLAVGFGIRAILNYAPLGPQVPSGIRLRNVDPILALQSMSYYLKS